MLAQGLNIKEARPVAFASRTMNGAEVWYPQLDLEAMGLDFRLWRFHQYLVGSPNVITTVTDHKPLCSIFNGHKQGSIRTERVKIHHQDINFHVIYYQGKLNQTLHVRKRKAFYQTFTGWTRWDEWLEQFIIISSYYSGRWQAQFQCDCWGNYKGCCSTGNHFTHSKRTLMVT